MTARGCVCLLVPHHLLTLFPLARMPFDVVTATDADGSPDGNSPITLAVSLDGMTKSPQIAPEHASLVTDYSETSPPSLIWRRKQHIYGLFFFPLGGEIAIV